MQNIKIAETILSRTNTEGRYEGIAFDELIASIKEKGLLVPILVRPVAGMKGIKHEVVAGNRRFAALKKLKETETEAKVQEMTDA